mgnify:CR=1 FL=1
MTLLFIHSPFPGCGKTMAANYLCQHHGFQRVSFADALRNVGRLILSQLGYSTEEIKFYLTTGKEQIIPGMRVTGRSLLQKLGTEFGRNMIDDKIWLRSFAYLCDKIQREGINRREGVRLVCDDLRFPNEFDYAQHVGGRTVWLSRNSAVPKKPAAPLFLQNLVWNISPLRKLLLHFFTFNHPSNNALKGREWEFDYVLTNNSTEVDLFRTLDMLIEELE